MAHTPPRFLTYSVRMAGPEEVWLPLVDEPVGDIVARIQAEDPEIERLIGSPHRVLAFRTFAYIRVGILLGELLFEQERDVADADETWVEALRGSSGGRGDRCGSSVRRRRATGSG